MFFDFLVRRKKPAVPKEKPKAVAFVDFEHWYIALDNLYSIRPDIKGWRDELNSKYDLQEIIVFADFSNPSLRAEIARIREVTNVIIETQNSSPHITKDFTDFIMLDHIYQKTISRPDIDVYVIFTGDGHFSSAVSFIMNRLNKPVVVYAVRDALSQQLRNTASEVYEVPAVGMSERGRLFSGSGRRPFGGTARKTPEKAAVKADGRSAAKTVKAEKPAKTEKPEKAKREKQESAAETKNEKARQNTSAPVSEIKETQPVKPEKSGKKADNKSGKADKEKKQSDKKTEAKQSETPEKNGEKNVREVKASDPAKDKKDKKSEVKPEKAENQKKDKKSKSSGAEEPIPSPAESAKTDKTEKSAKQDGAPKKEAAKDGKHEKAVKAEKSLKDDKTASAEKTEKLPKAELQVKPEKTAEQTEAKTEDAVPSAQEERAPKASRPAKKSQTDMVADIIEKLAKEKAAEADVKPSEPDKPSLVTQSVVTDGSVSVSGAYASSVPPMPPLPAEMSEKKDAGRVDVPEEIKADTDEAPDAQNAEASAEAPKKRRRRRRRKSSPESEAASDEESTESGEGEENAAGAEKAEAAAPAEKEPEEPAVSDNAAEAAESEIQAEPETAAEPDADITTPELPVVTTAEPEPSEPGKTSDIILPELPSEDPAAAAPAETAAAGEETVEAPAEPQPEKKKRQLPSKEEIGDMIISNLRYLADVSRTRERPAQPTFKGTVDAVSRVNKLPKSAVADALRKLIDSGVISQSQQTVGDNPDVKVITVDWEKTGLPLPEPAESAHESVAEDNGNADPDFSSGADIPSAAGNEETREAGENEASAEAVDAPAETDGDAETGLSD